MGHPLGARGSPTAIDGGASGGSALGRAHGDLWLARALTLGPVALVLPLASLAVFGFGADRAVTADVTAVVYSFGLFLGFTTSFWPLGSLRGWSFARRAESAALAFMVVSYATHLTWELGWLVLHDAIAASRDAAWAYPWWAYIDGGDARYLHAPPELLTMEALSVLNGLVGVAGLRLWLRSSKTDRRGVLMCMGTAVVHLYSVGMYYGSELVSGLPNVGSGPLDILVKFGLANAPWAVFPWLVLYWGSRSLRAQDASA